MKRFIVMIIVCCLAFSFVACNNSNQNSKKFTAYLGEPFYMPQIEGAAFEVKDSKGSQVEIVNLSFIPNSMSDYDLTVTKDKKTIKYTIEVVDRSAPDIKTSYSFRYVLAGNVELPVIEAEDSEIQVKVMSDGSEVAVTNGSFVAESGTYEILITAINSAGNSTYKTCYVQVTDNAKKLNAVTAFEESYGLKQFDRRYSLTPSYVLKEDLKPHIETKRIQFGENFDYKGLTQLYYTSEKITSIKGKIFLNNLLINDVSDYTGLYFYVYHDTQVADNSPSLTEFKAWVLLNETNSVELKPNDWTKVEVTDLDKLVTNSGVISYQQNFKLSDINGMLLTINNGTLSEERGFFFTDFYLYK